MKVKISDMMDYIEDASVDIREKEIASSSRIKEAAMKRIKTESTAAEHSVQKLSRVSVLVAVLLLSMLFAGTVMAYFNWNGFAFTTGLSKAEKDALLKDTYALALESVEPDGTVHYLDANGDEVMVLSAEEAAEYEQNRWREHLEELSSVTTLLDVKQMEVVPNGIFEVFTDEQGKLDDFALGNGYMMILCPDGEQGYKLRQNDTVTVRLSSNDACIMEFGMIRAGEILEAQSSKNEVFEQSFQIPEDGIYNFYMMYYSVDKSLFKDFQLSIE